MSNSRAFVLKTKTFIIANVPRITETSKSSPLLYQYGENLEIPLSCQIKTSFRWSHFKISQRLSPPALDVCVLLFVFHKLAEGKQHLLVITQAVGARAYALFKLENVSCPKWQCLRKAVTVMHWFFNSALKNAPNRRLTALKLDFGIIFLFKKFK